MRKMLALGSTLAGALLAATLSLCLVLPTTADDASTQAALESLFAALKTAPDAPTAQTIEHEIWAYWLTPPDPSNGPTSS